MDSVDFKQVIEDLQEKGSFEVPIREILEGKIEESLMRQIFSIVRDERLQPIEKYRQLTHLLGRERGTAVYRIAKKE